MSEGQESTPIIGIGASAGGLEALREVFKGFAAPTGMAFVVVQHLDPTHESLMAQLIERYTPMKVQQADGGEVLEADNVYVIPPGHGLAVNDGVLSLTEFSDPRGMRRPIDDFFESLALDRKRLAACVILSGTGADGSRGLRAIKEQGGIAVAQEPDSARYDGMPVSAIGTGLIDMVAEPGEIIDLLRRFFDRNVDGAEIDEEASEVIDHVDNLCIVLRETLGHDFSNYKRATLVRRVSRRMQILGVDEADEYLTRVREDGNECEALFRDLLINVTRFFRDDEEFAALQESAIEPLVRQARDAQEIRVWVAGCSSGEEAYTIAMMFAATMKRLDVHPYVQIFATDIDDMMLNIARRGTYPLSALPDIPAEFRTEYTLASSDTFTVTPKIRDMVRFSAHDLVRDPPFSNMSMISCRNLLIYFNDVLQKQVLPLFHFALRSDGGFLFLGSSEGIGRFEDLFDVIDQSARLYKRKNVKSRYSLQIASTRVSPSRRFRIPQASSDAPHLNSTEIKALNKIAETYAPVSLLVDEEGVLLERWGKAGKYLEFPDRMERNIHVPSLAREGLRELLGPMLREVRTSNKRVGARDVSVTNEFGKFTVTVICEPIGESSYLFVFRETGELEPFDDLDVISDFEREDGQMAFLEEELQSTRHRLRSTVEELETTNEELKSSNEEMMSMNEELQSTNEELTTVNDELKTKVDQITVANADLKNFFGSTSLVVLVVNGDLTLRSYTDAAQSLFTLGQDSIGRPLAEISNQLQQRDYLELAAKAANQGKADDYRATVPDGSEYFVRVLPYRDLDGAIDGATLIFTDVTEVLTLENELMQERERLRLALEVARVGIWEYEPSSDRTVLDMTERELLGLDPDDEGATMEPILAKLPADDRDRINSSLRQAMDGAKDFDEIFRVPLPDGNFRWLHGLGRRIETSDSRKFIGVTYDISAERELLEERELMIREMNHRVKNLFAVIAAMIGISARETGDITEFADDLRARIYALGRSHALTNENDRNATTTMRALIDTVIAPALQDQSLSISGDAFDVPVSKVTSLALILHEWATNSVKYGALSKPDGAIKIELSKNGDEAGLVWQETGGEGSGEGEAGFGTRLIVATVRQLQGTVSGEKTEEGYLRRLSFTVS